MLVCVFSHNLAHETAGAARTRHSPRPLFLWRETKGITRANRAAGSRKCVFCSLAPLLRGEGWGELYPRIRLAESPPHPDFSLCVKSDLSPQAGRGHPTRWRAMRIANEVPSRRLLAATGIEPSIDAVFETRKGFQAFLVRERQQL